MHIVCPVRQGVESSHATILRPASAPVRAARTGEAFCLSGRPGQVLFFVCPGRPDRRSGPVRAARTGAVRAAAGAVRLSDSAVALRARAVRARAERWRAGRAVCVGSVLPASQARLACSARSQVACRCASSRVAMYCPLPSIIIRRDAQLVVPRSVAEPALSFLLSLSESCSFLAFVDYLQRPRPPWDESVGSGCRIFPLHCGFALDSAARLQAGLLAALCAITISHQVEGFHKDFFAAVGGQSGGGAAAVPGFEDAGER